MMLARSALLIALLAAASQPLSAAPTIAGHVEPTLSTASVGADETKAQAANQRHAFTAQHQDPRPLVLQPNPAAPGDIVGARGPNPNSRDLHDIAVAADLGNYDRVDALTKQVRKFGVSREAIQHYQDRVRLHGDGRQVSPEAQQFGNSEADPTREAAWEASQ
jgi:hypothetical protein